MALKYLGQGATIWSLSWERWCPGTVVGEYLIGDKTYVTVEYRVNGSLRVKSLKHDSDHIMIISGNCHEKTKILSLSCNICDNTYATSSELSFHIKSHQLLGRKHARLGAVATMDDDEEDGELEDIVCDICHTACHISMNCMPREDHLN